jgi:AcrR family transcriptional regulator
MGVRAATTKKAAASSVHTAKTRIAEKGKSRKRRPEEVKARILVAAVDLFTTYGFRGVATHTIAAAAHVSLSLLLYHFRSKEALWKAMVTEMMQKESSALSDEQEDLSLSPSEQLRKKIVRLVHRFASTPALHRLMTLEGHQPSDRLLWLCDTYIAKEFHAVVKLIVEGQKDGRVRSANPARLRYAIIAFAAVPFSMSAEYQYLTKRNPFSSDEIDNTIALINKFVFIN